MNMISRFFGHPAAWTYSLASIVCIYISYIYTYIYTYIYIYIYIYIYLSIMDNHYGSYKPFTAPELQIQTSSFPSLPGARASNFRRGQADSWEKHRGF